MDAERTRDARHAPSRRELGPIELEVIHGTIRAAELEIEAAVERTARSPMIRDQHDYRVALFDAKGRKLTGRSYSAIVEPVFEYFGVDDIQPGDVFFWNDPYNSSGGIGHVPDLCTTVPIFYGDRLIGFSQVFGHHDDVGGSVPGSLPVHATDSWMEGMLIPPIKLYERGKRNEAAFRIIMRNSRLSEHLEGDLDAEIGAARLGCRRIEALASATASRRWSGVRADSAEHRRDLPPRDPAEDQGRRLSLRGLHRGRRRRRAAPARAPPHHDQDAGQDRARLHRHRSGGQGADQLGARRGRGALFPQVARADVALARRHAGARRRDRLRTRACSTSSRSSLPAQGHADHAAFRPPDRHALLPDAALARRFAACLSKATGGAMPADHETIRIWGLSGGKTQDDFFLFREVLGGGGPGRPWADGSDVVHVVPNSRNLPAEFSETRYPILVEQLGLKQDSGGAGYRRGGFGYDKRIRALERCAPHLQCRPLDPRLLRRQRRQGRLSPTRWR